MLIHERNVRWGWVDFLETICGKMEPVLIHEDNVRWGWARSLRENTKASKDSFMAEVMAVWSG